MPVASYRASRRLTDYAEPEGPAPVVAVEGHDVVYVKYRGTLKKLAIQNVRLATEEELLGSSEVRSRLS